MAVEAETRVVDRRRLLRRVHAGQDVAEAVKERQAYYKEIGKATKGVFDELKTAAPSVPQIQTYAKTIDALAPQVPSWFPKGSGPEAGVKTAAKAEIWTKPADFAKAADAFRVESATFYAVAQKGDLGAIKGEAGKLGGTCKACHEEFKARDEH